MMQAAVSPWARTNGIPAAAPAPTFSRFGPPPGRPNSRSTPARASSPIRSRARSAAIGSVEQLRGDEADLGVAGVLEVVDHLVLGAVVLIAGVTHVVAAQLPGAVVGALLADPAVDHGPE